MSRTHAPPPTLHLQGNRPTRQRDTSLLETVTSSCTPCVSPSPLLRQKWAYLLENIDVDKLSNARYTCCGPVMKLTPFSVSCCEGIPPAPPLLHKLLLIWINLAALLMYFGEAGRSVFIDDERGGGRKRRPLACAVSPEVCLPSSRGNMLVYVCRRGGFCFSKQAAYLSSLHHFLPPLTSKVNTRNAELKLEGFFFFPPSRWPLELVFFFFFYQLKWGVVLKKKKKNEKRRKWARSLFRALTIQRLSFIFFFKRGTRWKSTEQGGISFFSPPFPLFFSFPGRKSVNTQSRGKSNSELNSGPLSFSAQRAL